VPTTNTGNDKVAPSVDTICLYAVRCRSLSASRQETNTWATRASVSVLSLDDNDDDDGDDDDDDDGFYNIFMWILQHLMCQQQNLAKTKNTYQHD